MPALAPVDRLVTLEEVDELLLADDDEAAAAAPVAVELEPALVAEPVRVVIPLAAISVADACSIVSSRFIVAYRCMNYLRASRWQAFAPLNLLWPKPQ